MDHTFSEIYEGVPREARTDGVRALIALFIITHNEGIAAPTTGEVNDVISFNQPSAKPANLTATLRRLSPSVQPKRSKTENKNRWLLRPSGVKKLEELTGFDLTAPAKKSQLTYQLQNLHPVVQKAAERLMLNNHYDEAIGRAMKAVNKFVRDRSKRTKDGGVGMMHHVFSCESKPNTRLLLNSLEDTWQEDQQEGFRLMIAGAQQGIANVDKHGELQVTDKIEALEYLAFLSFLARQIEGANVIESQ